MRRKVRLTVQGLLLLTGFIAFACFWMAWPQRAASAFLVKRSSEQKAQGITNPFVDGTPESMQFSETRKPMLLKRLQKRKLDLPNLAPHSRSVSDLLLSRQTFDFGIESFTIERGKVVWGPESFWAFPGGRSYR